MTAYYNQGPYGVGHYSAGFVYDLSVNLPLTFGFAATTGVPVNAAGDLPVTIAFAGAPIIWPAVVVSGNLPVTFGLPGALAANYLLQGGLPLPFGLKGDLPASYVVSGGFGVGLAIGEVADAEITVQPLWNATVPCPSPWAPAEVCNG